MEFGNIYQFNSIYPILIISSCFNHRLGPRPDNSIMVLYVLLAVIFLHEIVINRNEYFREYFLATCVF